MREKPAATKRREEIAAMWSAGRKDEAKAAVLEWAEEDPSDVAARVELASALLSTGEQKAASAVATALPGDAQMPARLRAFLMHERVRAHLRAGELEAARAEAEAMTRSFPFSVPGWNILGQVAYWMDDLERAQFAFSRARFLSSNDRSRAFIDRFLLRIEVRQAEQLAQRDRIFELCDQAEREGFAADGWFERSRAVALWRLGRYDEALEALDRARDMALAVGPNEWDPSGRGWERTDAFVRALISVELDDDPATAERLALEARGEAPTENSLFPLAYVSAKANLPGAAEAISAYVSASDDPDDPDMILDLPSSDGRPWRDVLGITR